LSFKQSGIRLKIISSIYQNFPKESRIVRIDFEGPKIAVYVENPDVVNQEIVKKVAKEIKKRIELKASEKVRKDPKEASEIIKAIVPPEAQIVDVKFDTDLGEVLIKAKKPGLVIGKGGTVLQKIFAETKWKPVIVREPPIKSRTIDNILSYIYSETEDRAKNLRTFGERIHRDVIYKSGNVRVIGLGAFQEVGRSAVLVETPNSRVLLDAGLNPSVGWGRGPLP
jgi:Predicted metal-dependent RNase, consists of a metallo-beta-lactamase domain and an RNA-binding KH domain